MKRPLTDIPVLQKSREASSQPVKAASSCCSTPATAVACCEPSQSIEDHNGACCAQPEDGSACCDK